MKRTFLTIIALAGCMIFRSNADVVISPKPAVHGLYAGIVLPDSGQQDAARPVILSFGLATNKKGQELFIPKEEYFCRLSLTNEQGQTVARTRLGKRLGGKFDDLAPFSPDLIARKSKDRTAVYLATPGFMEKPFLWHSGRQISVNDLFEISKPGMYTCQIEFQAYGRLDNFSTNFTLIKFPPIKFPVVKFTP